MRQYTRVNLTNTCMLPTNREINATERSPVILVLFSRGTRFAVFRPSKN